MSVVEMAVVMLESGVPEDEVRGRLAACAGDCVEEVVREALARVAARRGGCCGG